MEQLFTWDAIEEGCNIGLKGPRLHPPSLDSYIPCRVRAPAHSVLDETEAYVVDNPKFRSSRRDRPQNSSLNHSVAHCRNTDHAFFRRVFLRNGDSAQRRVVVTVGELCTQNIEICR